MSVSPVKIEKIVITARAPPQTYVPLTITYHILFDISLADALRLSIRLEESDTSDYIYVRVNDVRMKVEKGQDFDICTIFGVECSREKVTTWVNFPETGKYTLMISIRDRGGKCLEYARVTVNVVRAIDTEILRLLYTNPYLVIGTVALIGLVVGLRL